MAGSLPPGQHEVSVHARFGLPKFASRFPDNVDELSLRVYGSVENELELSEELNSLARIEQISDFHCVTTWSVRGLAWEGVKFKQFFEDIVIPQAIPKDGARYVTFHCDDGYSSCMLLEDLLADDILLADTLNGEPLGLDHGGPLRLVAPAHYGYKSAKHLVGIELCSDRMNYEVSMPSPRAMEHPRARVHLEERGRFVPNWLLRTAYRSMLWYGRFVYAKARAKYYAEL